MPQILVIYVCFMHVCCVILIKYDDDDDDDNTSSLDRILKVLTASQLSREAPAKFQPIGYIYKYIG